MEPNINPYASPAAAVPTKPPGACPSLPLVLRPSLLTYAYVLPSGFAALGITVIFFFSYLSSFMSDISWDGVLQLFNPYSLIAAIVLFFGGFIAFACLMSLKTKVVISDSSIEIYDIPRRTIRYGDIESWYHHPATGSVAIMRSKRIRPLFIDNWAMSRKKSKLLGNVLREKVGPPNA